MLKWVILSHCVREFPTWGKLYTWKLPRFRTLSQSWMSYQLLIPLEVEWGSGENEQFLSFERIIIIMK